MEKLRKIFKNTSIQKFLVLLLGLFLTLLFLELSIRLAAFSLSCMQDYHNAKSMQERRECCIMCVGESTTASGYPEQLESILNNLCPGKRFSVINKGVPGTNTAAILAELENNLNRYKPDIVIAMMGANDSGKSFPYSISSEDNRLFSSLKTFKFARLLALFIFDKIQNNDPESLKRKELALLNQRDELSAAENNGKPDEKQNAPPDIFNSSYSASPAVNSGKPDKKPRVKCSPVQWLPPEYHAYFSCGINFMDREKYAEAISMFSKAIHVAPKSDMAYIKLTSCYEHIGNKAKVEEVYRKAIKTNPCSSTLLIEYGRYLGRNKRNLEAQKAFMKAVEVDPDNLIGYKELVACLESSKSVESEKVFRKAFEEALASTPKNWDDLFAIIELCEKRGKNDEAQALIFKALAHNPESRLFNGCAGSYYLTMGNKKLSDYYFKIADTLLMRSSSPMTKSNYRRIKEILNKRGVRLVCVQYPLRKIKHLKELFSSTQGIVFVDNEMTFKKALENKKYSDIFNDRCYGDFGHGTQLGNMILAENVAEAILRNFFGMQIRGKNPGT
jgi:tetratricopeptide (TPR) repeat protein